MAYKIVCLFLFAYMAMFGDAYPYRYGEDQRGNGSGDQSNFGRAHQGGVAPGYDSFGAGQQRYGPGYGVFVPSNQGSFGPGGIPGQGQNVQGNFGGHRGGYKEYGY